jgi:hypothetical protein
VTRNPQVLTISRAAEPLTGTFLHTGAFPGGAGRQPGHHTTPAFTRERAPRPPTPALLPWTTNRSATRPDPHIRCMGHDVGRAPYERDQRRGHV